MPPRRNTKKKNGNKNRAPSGQTQIARGLRAPPGVTSDRTFSQKFRYYNTSGSSFTLTRECIICPFYFSTTTLVGYPLVKTCRIKRITLYSPYYPAGSPSLNQISLQWLPPTNAVGDSGGLNTKQIIANASPSVPAFIDQKYRTDDVRGWFRDIEQYAANVFPRFQIQGVTDTLIDITYEFILADNTSLASANFGAAVTANRLITNTLHINWVCEGRTGTSVTP